MNTKDHAYATLSASHIRGLRLVSSENQTTFWARFGVTQSRGSRFENGGYIPRPILLLLKLYVSGLIDDDDLHTATQWHMEPPEPG